MVQQPVQLGREVGMARMSRCLRRAALTAAALATGAVSIGGCTGEDPAPTSATSPAPTSPSTTSSTTSPSATSVAVAVPVKPEFPAAAKKHTDAGAVAFVEYYWAAMNYAWMKPDTKILVDLGAASCKSCANLQDSAVLFDDKRQRFAQPPIAVDSAQLVLSTRDEARVITQVRRTDASLVDSSGKVLSTNTPVKGFRTFKLRWAGAKWVAVEFGEG